MTCFSSVRPATGAIFNWQPTPSTSPAAIPFCPSPFARVPSINTCAIYRPSSFRNTPPAETLARSPTPTNPSLPALLPLSRRFAVGNRCPIGRSPLRHLCCDSLSTNAPLIPPLPMIPSMLPFAIGSLSDSTQVFASQSGPNRNLARLGQRSESRGHLYPPPFASTTSPSETPIIRSFLLLPSLPVRPIRSRNYLLPGVCRKTE